MSVRNKLRLVLGSIFFLYLVLLWFMAIDLFKSLNHYLLIVLLYLVLYFGLLAYLERKLFSG